MFFGCESVTALEGMLSRLLDVTFDWPVDFMDRNLKKIVEVLMHVNNDNCFKIRFKLYCEDYSERNSQIFWNQNLRLSQQWSKQFQLHGLGHL